MGGDIDVLVVDEDPDVLELTETFLERESDQLSVTTEQSAQAAIDRVAEESFDCVVSDFRMPEMDGIELFEVIHDANPRLPFFLFSAVSDDETAAKAREAGVTAFVRKGVGTSHYEDLAERIENTIE